MSEISPYKITVYSESDPMIWRNASNPEAFKEKCTYKRYHQDTILEELNKFDAAILPKGNRPKDKFKSNNRTILANLAGLPVVTTMEELKELEDHKVRNQKAIDGQQIAIKEYNVKQSVREMQELINDIKSKKSNN